MAFTDETTIRTHTGWQNTDLVPSGLITQRIQNAHAALLVEIDPAYHESTDPLLILAETELATAYLLRSLATEAGFEERDLRTSNLTLRAGARVENLNELAGAEEASAWRHARPFLRRGTSRVPLRLVTGS